MTTNPATELARAVVQALLQGGVRHVVLAPGSRNAPLSFALASAADAGVLTLHSRLDERTAAFLALGLAKQDGRAAVVTTSGTAVANLHPAMLEAAHAGISLIAVTADRPAALRGTGANQTTDQVGIFGDAAPCTDIASAADVPFMDGGPAHWNVQFTEPLVPGVPTPWNGTHGSTEGKSPRDGRTAPTELPLGPRTVVVAGDDAGPPARTFAEAAKWPLLAEPTSGSRNGVTPIRTYRLLLQTQLAERIERVVVFGHPTLSRPVSQLLARPDVEVVSVRARGRWAERPFPVTAEHGALLSPASEDETWLDEWRAADADLSSRLDAFVDQQPELTPYAVAAEVNAALPPEGLLVVGASNPIRDLDLMARPYTVGERRKIVANRGLAGIDGTLSTAIGMALARPRGPAIAYLGDVTFLHDLNALVMGPGEDRPDLTIVVANDDGGSIFATLEQGAAEYAGSYEKLFGTPHGVDLASVCAGLRVPHWRVTGRAELRHALASPNGGIEVVEAVLRRDNRRELDLAIRGLAR